MPFSYDFMNQFPAVSESIKLSDVSEVTLKFYIQIEKITSFFFFIKVGLLYLDLILLRER